jgi:hypothetical protein
MFKFLELNLDGIWHASSTEVQVKLLLEPVHLAEKKVAAGGCLAEPEPWSSLREKKGSRTVVGSELSRWEP